MSVPKRRDWRPFEEAREFTRGLDRKGQKEWKEWCKFGQRPPDIPSNPNLAYKDEWRGWGNWLGTGHRWGAPPGGWRPMEEAREYVWGLGLKTWMEWSEWIKSDQRP